TDTAVGTNLVVRIVVALALLVVLLLRVDAALPREASSHRSLGAAAAQTMAGSRAGLDAARAGVLALLLGNLFLFGLTSHAQAVASAPDLALFVDWLHLVTAGIWIGGLLALAVAVGPSLGSWL